MTSAPLKPDICDLCVIDATGDGDTCSVNDAFWLVTRDQEVVANCVSRRVADRIVDALNGPAWQPIETAPKDGTPVLLLCGFDQMRQEMTIARWCDNPAPAGPFGRFCWREMQDSSIAEQVPTHWMPLPEPPAAPETKP